VFWGFGEREDGRKNGRRKQRGGSQQDKGVNTGQEPDTCWRKGARLWRDQGRRCRKSAWGEPRTDGGRG
jgi:hypothetical protein